MVLEQLFLCISLFCYCCRFDTIMTTGDWIKCCIIANPNQKKCIFFCGLNIVFESSVTILKK